MLCSRKNSFIQEFVPNYTLDAIFRTQERYRHHVISENHGFPWNLFSIIFHCLQALLHSSGLPTNLQIVASFVCSELTKCKRIIVESEFLHSGKCCIFDIFSLYKKSKTKLHCCELAVRSWQTHIIISVSRPEMMMQRESC